MTVRRLDLQFFHRSLRAGLAALALQLFLQPGVGHSAPPDAPAEPAQRVAAREARDEAFRLLQLEHWGPAIERLKQAYAAVPSPGFLLNIALAEQRRGDCSTALEYLARFRRECGNCSFSEQGRIRGRELQQACMGRLHLRSDPSGLPVRIGNEVLGTTPLDVERTPGTLPISTSSVTWAIDVRPGSDVWVHALLGASPPPPPDAGQRLREGMAWALAGAGAVALVVGTTYTVLAASSSSAQADASTPEQARALGERKDRETATAVVGLSVAALTGGAAALLWLGPGRKPPAAGQGSAQTRAPREEGPDLSEPAVPGPPGAARPLNPTGTSTASAQSP